MYQVKILDSVEKSLSKMDKQTVRVIKNWIIKNLVNTENPKEKGKALTGNLKGIWRYRVGDYRMFAQIKDNELIIIIFDIAHRKDAYKLKK